MLVKGLPLQDGASRAKVEKHGAPHTGMPTLFFPPFPLPGPAGSQSWGEKGAEAGPSLIPATLPAARGSGRLTPSPSSLVSVASGRTVYVSHAGIFEL